MSNLATITSIVGSSARDEFKKQREFSRKLVAKWEKTGLLEGIEREYEKHSMALLLENQAKQLIKEASQTGIAPGAEEWSGVALPIVRKVFGELASKEFVSVQPLSLPSGLVFYLQFKYGTNQPGFTVGQEVYGNTTGSGDPVGGFYGAGRFGYSLRNYTASVGGTIATASTAAEIETFWKECDFAPELSGSIVSGVVKKLVLNVSNSLQFDTEGIRAFRISSGSFPLTKNLPAYTKLSFQPTVSQLTFFVFDDASQLPTTGSIGNVTLYYQKGPQTILEPNSIRTDFEDRTGGPVDKDTDIGIPEIDLAWRSVQILARTRKLKATWTPEFAQDINAYHAIDAEAELTAMLSEYISMEVDLEILDMLIQNAATTEYWSAKIGEEVSQVGAGTSNHKVYFTTVQGIQQYNKQTWYQTLGVKIQKVSNKIHQKTMRGGANFIVTSAEIATILESLPGFTVDTDGNQMQYAMGVQKVGNYLNRFTVYKNPYMLENVILLGFRGSQFLETGAVYAPYIPLIMTPLVFDPNNFTPRKGIMTRYGKKIVRPEFYGKIVVANTNLI